MSSEWRSPQGEAQLTGSVVYRCAACGADIDSEPVFADEYGTVHPDRLTPTTKTYHPKHVPVTED